MKPITKQNITDFLDCQSMAIAGASRNEKSFSAQVAKHLDTLGYDLWLVNPEFEQVKADTHRVQSIMQLPSEIDHLLVLTSKSQTEMVINHAIAKGIKHIWIQQQSETLNAIEFSEDNNVNLIHNHCIFMFTQPEGIHKFHCRLKQFFGGLPK
ncbi:MAG: CoA-binding protein [Paludibacter sp.]|nr:CoA-binding protein [Paludibacter sp.]